MRKNRRPINLEKLKEDDARNSEKHAFLPRTKCKNEICLLRQALSSKMCSQIFCSPFTEPSALAFPWHHFQPKNYSAEITLTLFQKKTHVFPFFRWHYPSSIFDVMEYARRKVILSHLCQISRNKQQRRFHVQPLKWGLFPSRLSPSSGQFSIRTSSTDW